jgi:hypothetical protein
MACVAQYVPLSQQFSGHRGKHDIDVWASTSLCTGLELVGWGQVDDDETEPELP